MLAEWLFPQGKAASQAPLQQYSNSGFVLTTDLIYEYGEERRSRTAPVTTISISASLAECSSIRTKARSRYT
jgi:hypothetical protein